MALNRVKSDNHPISIFYRCRRRVQIFLEHHWPRLWISRFMVLGVGEAVKTATSVQVRLECFAENCPFAKMDFPELFTLEEREALQKKSDNVLQHRFDLLGSGQMFLGRRIRWHSDFVTGFRWEPSRLHSETHKLTAGGSDIKRPWELSRCQHLILLGLSWRVYDEGKYLNEYVSEIEEWLAQNPVGYGVNWACPMDVAIRAVNWLAGYALFSPVLSDDKYLPFRKKLTISLWEHARFIETHLEWNGPVSERRANHFLANLVGLFTLGVFFADTSFGRRWLKFSLHWIEEEMRHQVLDDGVHFECSTSYHRLCLEMFMWCYHLGKYNDVTFSGAYKKRLEAMRKFSSTYTRPDGMVPLFGDNDDGRLLYSGLVPINDHRYLWKGATSGALAADAALLAGNELLIMDAAPGLSTFSNAGFYIIRRPNVQLTVRAGRMAHLGAHAHCDQSSFELIVNGTPIIIDRGSYVYTSDLEKRNLYRGTRAHNVLTVNNAEQNRVDGKFFGMRDDTRTKVLSASEREIILQHFGFKALERSDVSHTRVFRLSDAEQTLEIFDFVHGVRNGDLVECFFHLSPELEVDCSGQTVSVNKKMEPVCEIKSSATYVRTERFDHSPSYGRLQVAKTLIFSAVIENSNATYKAVYLINWKV